MSRRELTVWLVVSLALVAAFAMVQFVVDPKRAYGPSLLERIGFRSVLLLFALLFVFGSRQSWIAARNAKSVSSRILYILLVPGFLLLMWATLMVLLMSFNY